jgi:chemotaxis protein CheX
MAVKTEIIGPFVAAAAEVLHAEAGVAVRRGQLSLASGSIITRDVATIVSVVGQVEGMVLYNLSFPMCLALVSRMVGQEFDQFDGLAQSGIAELGNVMAGRAVTKLSAAGFVADISVPTMVIGQRTQVTAPNLQRLVVPLETEVGGLEMHLALREKA